MSLLLADDLSVDLLWVGVSNNFSSLLCESRGWPWVWCTQGMVYLMRVQKPTWEGT